MKSEIIYGVRPVIEVLRSTRREVREVLDATGNKDIASEARRRGVRIQKVTRQAVEELAEGAVHQGVAARVGPYPYSGLEEILSMENPLVLVLDGVTDPRNLGAALRVADATGASGIVVPKDKAVGVTPVAVKASAGASEHVRIARETNLRRSIDRMKEVGLWTFAAEGDGKTVHTGLDMAGPVALVLGSEGKGVRRLVREGCDGSVSIPMLGAVGSLNVSVAAAVLLYEAGRQRGWPRT